MFLLDAPDEIPIDGFKAAWAEVGDSIVVVGGDGICSTATSTATTSVRRSSAGIDVGRPHKIRVTDLLEELEHREELGRRDRMGNDGAAHDPVPTAVVAVGVGPGVVAILKSMGVQAVVAGGQSMNPSTAELVAAVESVPADRGGDPAQQQEHHPGGRAGRRPDQPHGSGGPHPGVAEGPRLPDGLRPRGRTADGQRAPTMTEAAAPAWWRAR